MAIQRGYSWESGGKMIPSADLTSYGSFVTNSTGAAKTGSRSLYTSQNSASGAWRVPFDGIPDDASASFWLYNAGGYSTDRLEITMNVTPGGDIQFKWSNTTHSFNAYVNGSLVESGVASIATNTWFHVQIWVNIADTGYIGMMLDSVTNIDYTGDTKTDAGAAGAEYIHFTQRYGLGANSSFYVDDLVIGHDEGFMGVLYCEEFRPDTDTAVADFLLSTGSDHFATIDETPESTTDYNYSRVNGDADELEISGYDGTNKTIVLVCPWIYSEDFDGAGASIKVGMDSNGTDDVTQHTQGASYDWYWHDYTELNPDDSAEFEEADINALLVRYESVIP